MFDTHSNFGYGTITTAPSPGTSGTAIVLDTTTFAQFPDPGTSSAYNCTVWPYGTIPLFGNAEIVRVVSKGTNGTIGVTRAQESTSNIDIQAGYQFAMTWTKKKITDVEGSVSDAQGSVTTAQTALDYLESGWTAYGGTMGYVSGTVGTASGGVNGTIGNGDKLRFVQGGTTKYAYVDAIGTASVTINGGTDYTIANAAISDIYYSKADRPYGFPRFFNFSTTPTFNNTAPSGTSTIKGVFTMSGGWVDFNVSASYQTAGTGNTQVDFTGLPNAAGSAGIYNYMVNGGVSTGAWDTVPSTSARAFIYGVTSVTAYAFFGSADCKAAWISGRYPKA